MPPTPENLAWDGFIVEISDRVFLYLRASCSELRLRICWFHGVIFHVIHAIFQGFECSGSLLGLFWEFRCMRFFSHVSLCESSESSESPDARCGPHVPGPEFRRIARMQGDAIRTLPCLGDLLALSRE